MGLKCGGASKSGTGLQFNEDVLFTEDLQKNCTPVPDFANWTDRVPVTACNCRFKYKARRLHAGKKCYTDAAQEIGDNFGTTRVGGEQINVRPLSPQLKSNYDPKVAAASEVFKLPFAPFGKKAPELRPAPP